MPKIKNDSKKAVSPKVSKPSAETQVAANKVAKSIQKPGQTKEQTKLIEQGIQKGIELYKKQHKAKARAADKAKKKLKNKIVENSQNEIASTSNLQGKTYILPWLLLALSWLGFIIYLNI